MKSRFLFALLTFGLVSAQVLAHPVSAEVASQKAKSFLSAMRGEVELTQVPAGGVAAARGLDREPLLHVFNVGQDEGFIILSGEDSTPAVLGYADSGSFCYDQLPQNARAWIDGYADQIAAMRQMGGGTILAETPATHEAVKPMLTSQWDQLRPYNSLCPLFVLGTPSATGCVATAMAQVLYYYRDRTVKELQATIPAYDCRSNYTLTKIHVDAFAKGTPIDWSHMRDRYDDNATEAERQAVASLMAYCGASIEMDYRDDENGGSTASEISVPMALKKYFGFNPAATVKYRSAFSNDNWDRLVYRELAHGRPVIFSGKDMGGHGHAFVSDGYDGNGYYHINWGWGGRSDGYFLLSDLRPALQGTGGYGGSYNENLGVVIGMEPGDGTPYEEQIRLTVTGVNRPDDVVPVTGLFSVVRFNYSFELQNRTSSTRSFDWGLALYDGDRFVALMLKGSLLNFTMVTTHTTSGYFEWYATNWQNGVGLGDYQVKVVCKELGSQDWLLADGASRYYVDVKVEADQIVLKAHGYVEPEVDINDSGISAMASPRYEPASPSGVYTLTGRKLTTAADQLPPGFYIIDGKKRVVK